MGVFLSGNWLIQTQHTLSNAIKKRGGHSLFRTIRNYISWRAKYWMWLRRIEMSIDFCVCDDMHPPPGNLLHCSSQSSMVVWSKLSDEPWKQTNTNTTKETK